MLQINKLCKRYGKFQALNNLDLSIPKGEFLDLLDRMVQEKLQQ